jgi:hypothetical protein
MFGNVLNFFKLFHQFVSGVANMRLIELWEDENMASNRKHGVIHLIYRRLGAFLVLLVGLALVVVALLCAPPGVAPVWVPLLLAVSGIAVGIPGVRYSFANGDDTFCLRDLDILGGHFGSCGAMSVPELEAAIKKFLLAKAGLVASLQAAAKRAKAAGNVAGEMDGNTRADGIREDEFVPSFNAAKPFGLVAGSARRREKKDEGYRPFFAEAEALIASATAVPAT